eukprot:TRINITY_DN26985_c0_g1_i1.p1 TRINITY_DN26985_c0_g1~~TRINITY_DN26985_c0_g1_i1.p1  ORF type:complete len:224 (+),score=17.30 TRINITY_DN26985_c0_g1_i1:44-673(+)
MEENSTDSKIFVVPGVLYTHIKGMKFDESKGNWVVLDNNTNVILHQTDDEDSHERFLNLEWDKDNNVQPYSLYHVKRDRPLHHIGCLLSPNGSYFTTKTIEVNYKDDLKKTVVKHSKFIFDTGATVCVIPKSWRSKIFLCDFLDSSIKIEKDASFSRIDLVIDSIYCHQALTLVSDSEIPLPILGMNVISKFRVNLDLTYGGSMKPIDD